MAGIKTLSPDSLAEITRRYGTTPAELSPLTTGNSLMPVYEYARNGHSGILKLIPPNPEINLESLQSILDWTSFLAGRGGPVVAPIRSEWGNLLETWEVDGSEWIALAVEKAPGTLAENLPLEAWDDRLIHQLGRTLGCCHRLAMEYAPSSGILYRPGWQEGDNCFHPGSLLPGAEPAIREKYVLWLGAIQLLPKERENYGLAHLDLHLANFLVDPLRKEFTFIDFDDCGYGWFAMDIAMLLFDVLVVHNGEDPRVLGGRFLRSFLAGYRAEKEIKAFWVEQLPAFLKLLEIGVYLDCEPPYDPVTAGAWGRKYMPGRRERILDELPYVDLDFKKMEGRKP